MKNKGSNEKLKRLVYKRRINFIFFGIFIQAIVAFGLSFTSFTLKGAYFPQLLAAITYSSILYSWLKKKGKIDKYIHD